MPIISGLAAMAVLSNGFDQAGIDPQVDKQFAIVKQADPQPMTVTSEGSQGTSANIELASGSKTTGSFSISVEAQGVPPAAPQGGAIPVPPSTNVFAPAMPAQATPRVFSQNRAAPALAEVWSTSSSLQRMKGMDRKVSVKFNNATASDVLKWLSKQNVNFVANTESLPKSKITVNLNNVPLHEALESVAQALGGNWQVNGSTLIFRTGFFSPQAFGVTTFNSFPKVESKVLELRGLGGMTPFIYKADPLGKMYEFKLDEKALKDLKNLKGRDGKGYEFKIDQKALDDFKKMRTNPDAKVFDQDAFRNTFKGGFGMKKVDAKKFLDSMTQSQKELMKTQGYLRISDLTADQKAMLFENPKAELPKEFTFMLNVDGQMVKVKN